LDRVVQVIQATTGVRLSRPTAWRLLTQRLGWSLQRPERQAKERDEQAIARWVAHEWPRIKKMTCAGTPSGSSTDDRAGGLMAELEGGPDEHHRWPGRASRADHV
jgi:hypothetical protein